MKNAIRIDRRIVIIVFVGLLLSAITQIAFASRQAAVVDRETQARAVAESQLRQIKERVGRLTQAGVVDSSTLTGRIRTLEEALPTSIDDFTVLERVETTARELGLGVEKLQRGREGFLKTPSGQDLRYVEYDIVVAGSVNALAEWIGDRLGDQKLLISIDTASLQGRAAPGSGAGGSLTSGVGVATLKVRIWYSGLPGLANLPTGPDASGQETPTDADAETAEDSGDATPTTPTSAP
jgi:type II secretory pathway pseudopilin PulG